MVLKKQQQKQWNNIEMILKETSLLFHWYNSERLPVVKSLVLPLEYHWNNSENTVLFLIPLSFSGIAVTLKKTLEY